MKRLLNIKHAAVLFFVIGISMVAGIIQNDRSNTVCGSTNPK